MRLHAFKLWFKRRLRKRQRQVEGLGLQAEEQLEQHFFKRIGRLGPVWRFATSWMLLWVLLIGILVVQIEALSSHFQTTQPVPGGTYTEGIVGTFTNADPLYASSDTDLTVSRLVFSSLLKYNSSNQLEGDLAQSWSVDKTGTLYTVHLRPNVKWQDGEPLTADDVVFTYHTIQDPDAQSSLNSSWQGITVSASDSLTVTFKLPNPLSSFPYSLTNGIVPQHILKNVSPVDLRSSSFNTQDPIGSGPFMWQAVKVTDTTPATAETQIELQPFADYYGGGPKLNTFIVHVFAAEPAMIASFRKHQLTAMAGVSHLPSDLAKSRALHRYSMLLTAAKMVFFNTSQGALQDAKVRQALVKGANVDAIVNNVGYPTVPVREPLLRGQLGYDAKYRQATDQPAVGRALLDKDGWKVGKDGVRYKQGLPLTFTLYLSQNTENDMVAAMLQQQWRKELGVQMNVQKEDATDFNDTVASRSYDALLYGIAIGIDPDVFVYWDSSQSHSTTGQNYSLYSSATADSSLESGRTRSDPTLRAIKYKPFLQAWQTDAPALGLYQPRYLYVSWTKVYGLDEHRLNTGIDRFANVQNWEIREAKVTD
ncbi:MAG TPA: peptide ABC transporter substrate-binding protein [Candidatus Saccharimonadales bacterium]|nr:peptide ABC transporter substrate-binding protein [Candidatus Saccharimonadales bacterium]